MFGEFFPVQFGRAKDGNIALTAALALPIALALAGAAIDFSRYHADRNALQEFADTLALRGARELSLASSSDQTIVGAVTSAAHSLSAELGVDRFSISVSVNRDDASVKVDLSQEARRTMLPVSFAPYNEPLTVSSEAVARGGRNVCVVALRQDGEAFSAQDAASLSAPTCAVLSNSTSKTSILVTGKAELDASLICSAGGYEGGATAFTPRPPLTDCPLYDDPLADRSPPPVGACTNVNTEIGFVDSGKGNGVAPLVSTRLSPGVYCGGLKIRDNAHVEFDPGVYVVKDGPLLVGKHSDLVGEGVGFYLTGDVATFLFEKDASIDLTAPTEGPLAGILFFEDRNAPLDRDHIIQSEDARTLLGTFYLPRGNLVIDTQKPVADRSAYTAIIARRVTLAGKPTLVINADYALTDVPVPSGLGPVGADVYLRE